MKKEIHVVYGSTGEYSDHIEWYVAAYHSETKAQDHVLRATARANELIAKHGEYNIPEGANEHDASMRADYTGTRYTYATVPILDEPA
jgi:hypothetical protein